MSEIKMGIYRHYKGPLYQVLGLAHDANESVAGSREHEWTGRGPVGDQRCVHCDQDPRTWFGEWCESVPRIVVVYIGLQLDGAHLGPRLAVRTLEDFVGTVCLSGDQEMEHAGRTSYTRDQQGVMRAKRFEYLGPELTREMIE